MEMACRWVRSSAEYLMQQKTVTVAVIPADLDFWVAR